MPLYEFRCPSGHHFEKFYRSIGSSLSEEKCPECGLVAERLISAAGLVFKGSGFYITDYGKDGKKPQQTAPDTTSKSADSGSSESAGESKSSEAKSSEPKSSESKSSDSKPAAKEAKPAAPSKKAE